MLITEQLDDRYFQGLEGRYNFELHFRLYKDDGEKYLGRSMGDSGTGRSCSLELSLEEGYYSIYVKILADRIADKKTADEMIREYKVERKDKLLAVGHSFDVAHSKGRLKEWETAREKAQVKKMQSKARENRKAVKKIKQKVREKVKRNQKRKAHKVAEKRAMIMEERLAEAAANAEARRKADSDRPTRVRTRDAEVDGESVTAAQNESDMAAASNVTAAAKAESTTAGEKDLVAEVARDGNEGGTEDVTTTTSTNEPITETQDEPNEAPESAASRVTEEESTAGVSPDSAVNFAANRSVAIINGGTSTVAVDEALLSEQVADITIQDGTDEDATDQRAAAADEESSRSAPRSETERNVEAEDSTYATPGDSTSARQESPPAPSEPAAADDWERDSRNGGRSFNETYQGERVIVIDDRMSVSSVVTDDFDWQSDIDGPVFSDSEERDELPGNEQDLFGDDPWNALCVVGMRVYTENANAENAEVNIQVVRPSE